MDLKTQRYMQRIEQIMQMPKKGTPHRPSKSPNTCKPNHLDRYLKYQLSSKIIQKIFDRYNQMLVQQFFNIIRITEYRQKEKIYRFIAVEKAEPTREMWVDGTIVCKMLSTTLKQIIKKRYTDFINLLQLPPQSPDFTPQKFQMNRRQSVREASLSPVSARMRAFTNISKLQRSSQHNLSQIDLFQLQRSRIKIGDFAVKNFVNMVNMKIRSIKNVGFLIIKKFYLQERMNNKQNLMQNIQNVEEDTKQIKQQKNLKKCRSIILIINSLKKSLSQALIKLNKYDKIRLKQLKKANLLVQATSKISQKQTLCLFHTFFTNVRTANSTKKPQQQNHNKSLLQVSIRSKSKSAVSNKARSHNTDQSNVEQYNPSANLIFFAMVNKVMKLMMAISKLLIPYKQAFIKIDHYASYSYRIQQSLKCIPQRTLNQAFQLIKHYAFSPKIAQKKKQVDKQKVVRFNEMLYAFLKPHIIEGFTHIKIISKERDLKIKIHPAKQNIVEMAKKFIQDRGQYTNQSYYLLQELKSAIISGNSSEKSNKPKSSIR